MPTKLFHSLPWMAAVVALIMPPAGMLMISSPFGALGYGLFTVASWNSAYVMQVDNIWPYARVFFPAVVAVHIIAAIHCYQVVVRAQKSSLPLFRKIYLTSSGLLIVFVALSYFIFKLYFQCFNIASASMAPNLLHGDKVLAKKLSNPSTPLAQLTRGDVIIFKHPDKNEFQVKRIIGLPGDSITYSQQKLAVNGIPVYRRLISPSWDSNDGLRWMRAPLYDESIAGTTQRVLIQDEHFGHKGKKLVPPNSVFVMGDNRNMSIDSRNFGVINSENIVAKPLFIWFSSMSMPQWTVRWNRIGPVS